MWGPWIEHDGRGVPLPLGTWVQMVWDDHAITEGPVGGMGGRSWDWRLARRCGVYLILHYRVKKPRGLEIIEGILADVESQKRVEA